MYFTGSVRIHISACDDFRLCSARLRYADAHRQCPLIGDDQKLSADGQSDEIVRPWLRCGSSSGARSGAPTSSSTRHSSMSPASCVRDTRAIGSCRSPVICPSGGLSTGVSSPVCKNISVFTSPKSLLELFVSHPTRGAYHDRDGRGMGCGGRGSVLRAIIAGRVERLVSDRQARGREMLLRTAKSCGPDAPTLASSSRSCVGPTGLRQNDIR
jgi:hypothetical protein